MQVGNGGFDGTAFGMAEDEDQGNIQLGDAVFEAAVDGGSGTVGIVSGDADSEDVAYTLIKENFGRDARVTS